MSRGTRSGSGSVAFGQQFGLARPVAYTPTVTWPSNTITTQSGLYIKMPGMLLVWCSFVVSASVGGAVLTVTIPAGYTASTLAGSLAAGVGVFSLGTASTTNVGMVASSGATTQIQSPIAISATVATWSGFFMIPTVS